MIKNDILIHRRGALSERINTSSEAIYFYCASIIRLEVGACQHFWPLPLPAGLLEWHVQPWCLSVEEKCPDIGCTSFKILPNNSFQHHVLMLWAASVSYYCNSISIKWKLLNIGNSIKTILLIFTKACLIFLYQQATLSWVIMRLSICCCLLILWQLWFIL